MIWMQVATTGLSAAMAGALAVPAARRLLLGNIETDWLQDELELDGVDPDGLTVRGKDGALSRVWRLSGVSYDAKVEPEQATLKLNRASLVRELGKSGLHLRFFAVKRQRPIDLAAAWPSPALQEIGDAEAAQFRESYYVEWFIMATSRSMKPLFDAHDQITATMADYGPEPVAREEADDAPCPLTGFLNGLVSGDYRADLPSLSSNLSGALPGSDLDWNREKGIAVTHTPELKVHKIITVSLWPDTVSGRLIGDVLSLAGDIEVCQIGEPWKRDKATLLFERRRVGEENSWFGNAASAAETEAVLQLLAEDALVLFATQFQITLRADTEADLDKLVRSVSQVLASLRVLHKVQTAGAPACWFARLPFLGRKTGKLSLLPGGRLMAPLDLRDDNLAALWALPHSALGLGESQFGPAPVRMFRTPSGQAYSFQFQVENKKQARGNYLVFAPTGGGKSTLMMHLLGGLAKFDGVPSYIFDSKEGARFMVEAFGGVYQSYDTLALNPLDVGEDTPSNRNRVYSILRAMTGGMTLTHEDKDALTHAAELAFHVDSPDQPNTLSAIYPFAFQKRTELRSAFSKWVVDDKGSRGLHSHVFNAQRDSLSGLLDHFMVGINMNEALDDPELGPPVVAHIATAIHKSAANNSRGFTIFIDEAAKLLQNPGFRDLAAEMFREYRKLDGAVGLAFQDPKALMECGKAEAFIENTATFIFLPNASANPESFAPFNLNEEQLAFAVGRATKKKERRVLIVKRDAATGFDESAIVDVNLSSLGDALRFYRAGNEANRDLDKLKQTWGDEWQRHL